jgi:hypothetical protein
VQAWDRYAYVNNSPINYTDPTGHMFLADGDNNDKFSQWKVDQYFAAKAKAEKERTKKVDQDESRGPKLPYKDNNGDSSIKTIDSPNPPLSGLIAAGVVLTTGIVISEWLFFNAEVAIAGIMIAGTLTGPMAPLAEATLVGFEAILMSCSLILIDTEVAYISYIVRVAENPSVKQEFEFLYPWGLSQ